MKKTIIYGLLFIAITVNCFGAFSKKMSEFTSTTNATNADMTLFSSSLGNLRISQQAFIDSNFIVTTNQKGTMNIKGRLGVGDVAAPIAQLDVQALLDLNDIRYPFNMRINNTTGTWSGLSFSTATTPIAWILHYRRDSGSGFSDLAFAVSDGGAATTQDERMRIRYDGNVGIGEKNPANKLVVEGTASASIVMAGAITVDGRVTSDTLFVRNDITGNANLKVIGNIIAGGSAPGARMHIKTPASPDFTGLLVEAGNGATDKVVDIRDTASNRIMKILQNGRMVLGFSTPNKLLVVEGVVSASVYEGRAVSIDGNMTGAGSVSVDGTVSGNKLYAGAGGVVSDGDVTANANLKVVANIIAGGSAPGARVHIKTPASPDFTGLLVESGNGATDKVVDIRDTASNRIMKIIQNGNMVLGFSTPNQKLVVEGRVSADEMYTPKFIIPATPTPSSPVAGQFFTSNTNNIVYVWDGSAQWEKIFTATP